MTESRINEGGGKASVQWFSDTLLEDEKEKTGGLFCLDKGMGLEIVERIFLVGS